LALSLAVAAEGKRSVQDTVAERSGEGAKPSLRTRGTLGSIHCSEHPLAVHSAPGVSVAAGLSASGDAVRVMTWYELYPEKTGEFVKSSFESAQVVAPHRISRKMQHHVEMMRDDRRAGSSGLDGPQDRPCLCSPLFSSLTLIPEIIRIESRNRTNSEYVRKIE
jgi:hypothetical protein